LFPPERTLCVKLLKASSLYSEHLNSVWLGIFKCCG
jgi:hypothetical protein